MANQVSDIKYTLPLETGQDFNKMLNASRVQVLLVSQIPYGDQNEQNSSYENKSAGCCHGNQKKWQRDIKSPSNR